ncbi:MAG: tetratricopeptide repeat protein, partial [Chthoniobacterales bacterium]|nr:tetratricopeptide repeat protein [Chthoniobacterales bacterium]
MESDVSQQILAELQKLRRFTKRALITVVVLFATFVVAAVWQGWSREGVYADANRATRALDYRRAIQVAEKMAAEHPQDYSLFEYLGDLYLRSGDLAKAEKAYSRSNSLNPSEELSKTIETIRNSRVPTETAHSPTPTKGGTEAMIEPTPLTSQLPQNQA